MVSEVIYRRTVGCGLSDEVRRWVRAACSHGENMMRNLTILLLAAMLGAPALALTGRADDKDKPATESMDRVEERISDLDALVTRLEKDYAKEGYYDEGQKESICRQL